MAVYTSLGNAAVKLIDKFGRDVDLFTKSDTPSNPAKPWRGGGTETEVTVRGVVASFEKEEVDGDRIQATDAKLLVAAGDPGIGVFDMSKALFAELGEERFGALYVDRIMPGDQALVYIYRLRK